MDLLQLLVLGGLVLAGLGFLRLVSRCAQDTVFGISVALGLYVLNTFVDDGLPPIAPGGITITIGDVTFGILMTASAMIVLRRRSFHMQERLLLLLFGLIAWSIARGAVTYGVTAAFNEGRTMLYVYGAALYVGLGRFTAEDRHRFGRVWLAVAWGLVAIAVFRWIAFFAGVPPVGVFSRVQEAGTLRVIDSRSTLMVVAAVMMLAPRWLKGTATTAERTFVVVGTLAVLLLQHRTLYVVFFIAALYLAWEDPRLGGRVVAGLLVVAAMAGALFFAFAPQDTTELRGVAQSPVESETVEWRIVGWQLLLEDPGFGIGGAFVGRPSGAGWERTIGFSEVDVNPHNWFIQDFLRVGLLGVAAHLGVIATGWRRLRRTRFDADRDDQLMTPRVARVWVVSALAFGTLWSMSIGYGVMLGLLGALWVDERDRPDQPSRAGARGRTAFDLPELEELDWEAWRSSGGDADDSTMDDVRATMGRVLAPPDRDGGGR